MAKRKTTPITRVVPSEVIKGEQDWLCLKCGRCWPVRIFIYAKAGARDIREMILLGNSCRCGATAVAKCDYDHCYKEATRSCHYGCCCGETNLCDRHYGEHVEHTVREYHEVVHGVMTDDQHRELTSWERAT